MLSFHSFILGYLGIACHQHLYLLISKFTRLTFMQNYSTENKMSSSANKLPINQYFVDASQLILGTMNLGGGWNNNPISKEDITQAHTLLEHCLSVGINVIDIADIYTFGKAESVIGEVFKQNRTLREQFIVQSKVGIKLTPTFEVKQYDLSGRWVTESLNASLKRLNIDYLDVLFLHRPDPLMQIKPLSETLSNLHKQDKFDFLAVSNMHAGQIALIQTHTDIPVIANQLEMSLLHSGFIEDGITTNMHDNAAFGFPRGTLEYCIQQNVQLQAWGAMAQGQFTQLDSEDKNIAATAKLIKPIAEQHDCHANAIVLAWLMMHPAQIQPVIGSTQTERITQAAKSTEIQLTREQWYQIFETRRGNEVP